MATPNYAISSDVFGRVKPKIRQWEITTGRKIDPSTLQSLFEAEMMTETKAADSRYFNQERVRLDQERVDLAKKAQEDAADAAKVSGVTNLAYAGGAGYLGYKSLKASEKTAAAYEKLAGGVTPGGQAPLAVEGPAVPAGTKMAPGQYEQFRADYFDSLQGTGPGVDQAAFTPAGGGELAVSSEVGATAAADVAGPAAYGAQEAIGGAAAAEAAGGGGAQLAVGAEETAMMAGDAGAGFGGAGGAASEGMAAEGLAAETAGAELGLGSVALPVLGASVGHSLGRPVSKMLGTHQKTTEDVMGVAGGAAAGWYVGAQIGSVGGPVGAVVGGLIGLGVSLVSDSVICNELHRQNRITDSERRWCMKFKQDHVSVSTFLGYLAWASPIVRQMRKEKWFNKAIRPFALALTIQWVNIARGVRGSLFQRSVYRVAYIASRMAWHLREQRRVEAWLKANKEVCHG